MNWTDYTNKDLTLPGTLIPGKFGYRRISAAEYHAFPAISAGLLKCDTPAEMFAKITTPQKDTDALTDGTLVHMAVLEPQTSWASAFALAEIPINPRTGLPYGENTKKGEEAWALAREAHPGKIIVTEESLKEHLKTCRQLQQALHMNADAMSELQDFEGEVSGILWHPRWNCWVKWRPDILPKHMRYLPDVKTTRRHPRQFEKDCWEYGYHLQAVWYAHCHELLLSVLNLAVTKTPFIVLAKDQEGRAPRPPMCRVADLPLDPSLNRGVKFARGALGIPEGLSRVDRFLECARQYVEAGEPQDFAGIRRCWPAYEFEQGETGRWLLAD